MLRGLGEIMVADIKDEIAAVLKFGKISAVIGCLMYMTFNIDDASWVQERLLETIGTNADDEVRSLAVTCLGHMARLHGRIDKERVVPILAALLQDQTLSGRAQDALDDIEIFAK
jgi:hypothetical protein